MSRDPISLLHRLRSKLGVGGDARGGASYQKHRDRAVPVIEPKTAANRAAPPPVPAEHDFFSGPPNASAYVNTPDRLSGVAVRKPAGTIPGSLDYPRARGTPPTPTDSRPQPPEKWEFFHRDALTGECRPWGFPAYLDNPDCRWLQTLKKLYNTAIAFPASISPEGGLLLHSIVRNLKPRTVVETGTFLGASALWIASALAENGDGGVLHCYDDFVPIRAGAWRLEEMKEGVLELVASRIAEAGLEKHVIIHPGNTSHEIRASIAELKAAGGVQMAYLDADHRPLGVCQDFWAVEPVLQTGGLVVLHDTFPTICGDTGPGFLMDHINEIGAGTYHGLDLYLSPFNYGMGVVRRIG